MVILYRGSRHPCHAVAAAIQAAAASAQTVVDKAQAASKDAGLVAQEAEDAARIAETWNNVSTLCVTPDDRFAISGGEDNILRKHDLASGVEVCRQQNAHSEDVYQARCASNGAFFVTCGVYENFFKVWKTENLELIQQVEGHD